MPICYLLQGIPGCGKSTFARTLPDTVIVSADSHMVDPVTHMYDFQAKRLGECHRKCLRHFVDIVTSGQHNVCVDNTNITRVELAPYAALALAYGYRVEIHRWYVLPTVAASRGVHAVPLDTVQRMSARVERPLSYWGAEILHDANGSVIPVQYDSTTR